MRIINDIKLEFNDVIIKPKRSTLSSRNEVILERIFHMKHSNKTLNGIPIIASNMDTVGTFEMAKVLADNKVFSVLHKFYSINDIKDYFNENIYCKDYVFVCSGITQKDLLNLDNIIKETHIDKVCLDVANGYTENFINIVREFRSKYPEIILIAGNVCTPEMTEELILSGADIVKCGISGGSACLTRPKTGVGYPQLSCVIECSDAAHGLNGMIISDGGCKVPADIAKAFGGGADFVMLGGMLAGHKESGGKLIEENGEKYKEFYGMSSDVAMNKYYGKVASYRASEGAYKRIQYKGEVINTLQEILGSLRSTCTYMGAQKLKEISKRCTFIKIK